VTDAPIIGERTLFSGLRPMDFVGCAGSLCGRMKNDLQSLEDPEQIRKSGERLSLAEQLVRVLVLVLAFAYSYILLN